ncbi:helix-turn-helix domain-containing protein [Aestuariispira insulae]|uniref:Helix-turn-helix protein n=1 Tax=Aestuariispira insulae TaxID=1461337 RepID=A0A3D9HI37_9PROT|nr:helix-turn-helix transcriptional regulator [Aestuariispira insulae]RED49128.1 helix-turn-helix protein [Aestuariispira insulae]
MENCNGNQSGGRRPNDIDRHVGRQIRALRKEKRVTQQELGATAGISFKQIRKYENGENRVSAGMLYSFGKYLNVKVERFFEGLSEVDERAYVDNAEQPRLDELTRLVDNYVRMHDGAARRELLELVRTIASD